MYASTPPRQAGSHRRALGSRRYTRARTRRDRYHRRHRRKCPTTSAQPSATRAHALADSLICDQAASFVTEKISKPPPRRKKRTATMPPAFLSQVQKKLSTLAKQTLNCAAFSYSKQQRRSLCFYLLFLFFLLPHISRAITYFKVGSASR